MVPAIAARLQKLGGRLHMQPSSASVIDLADTAFPDVVFVEDEKALVSEADVVLAVQAPATEIIATMRESAMRICILDEQLPAEQVKALLVKKMTCFAMQTIPRISRHPE